MPLIESDSKKAMAQNYNEMKKSHHPTKQAIAAMLRMADEAKKAREKK